MSNRDGKNRIKRLPKDASYGYNGVPYLPRQNSPNFRKLCRKAGRAKARSDMQRGKEPQPWYEDERRWFD